MINSLYPIMTDQAWKQ